MAEEVGIVAIRWIPINYLSYHCSVLYTKCAVIVVGKKKHIL